MDLAQIAVMLAAAALYVTILPVRWRGWALMIGSAMAIYWLQPSLAIRWLDYALPTATLALAILGWYFTLPSGAKPKPSDAAACGVIVLIILVLSLARYIEFPLQLTTRPPPLETIVIALVILSGLGLLFRRFLPSKALLWAGLFGMIALFIVVKTPTLAQETARLLRLNAGQDASLAVGSELGWLGFSYVAFRLIQTFRDRQSGLLPELTLSEYLTFILFAPAFAAGPIARAENFVDSYRALPSLNGRDAQRLTIGLSRIASGMFKKFVIADSLAVFSLSHTLAEQAQTTGSLWVMLYAYGLRLYFDFSGYTDIAIGLGILFGILLPENFDRPYLKNNIAAFWQSWHKSLSDWVRFYVYSPLSRAMLRRKPKPSNYVIIFISTAATMVIIGLWHEVALPFLIWGLWHAGGLFVHKVWSDKTRTWYRHLTPGRKRVWTVAGVLITLQFVMLGWVWFAMPSLNQALAVFAGLFGVNIGGVP